MILFVNGDSHTAAAEAVNSYAFAEDDANISAPDRRPHPDNLRVSWGQQLANALGWQLVCYAESASSNSRIIRTTKAWLNHVGRQQWRQCVVIIQWSTWEREEWYVDSSWYQVTASGTDHVPKELRLRYLQYISELNWLRVTEQAHRDVFGFHQQLRDRGIAHVFFNGNSDFSSITKRHDWGQNYIKPYCSDYTFNKWLINNNFSTVRPGSWHFGAEPHSAWANFMLPYVLDIYKKGSDHALSVD